MNRILLIGYGNPDRQDDGIAWHILREYCTFLGLKAPLTYDDEFPVNIIVPGLSTDGLDFAFYLQLTPEMAEDISERETICFLDAHTGDIPDQIRMIEVKSEFQRSPFTHHLTPQSLLSMCESIYGKKPRSALLSVRGYQFGFSNELSYESRKLLPEAVRLMDTWLREL